MVSPGFIIEPSRYPSAPLASITVMMFSFQESQFVPLNLSDSEKIGGTPAPEVVKLDICDGGCMRWYCGCMRYLLCVYMRCRVYASTSVFRLLGWGP